MVIEPRRMVQEQPRVAVLCSGGLDSTVLVALQACSATVLPVYVRSGLAWEKTEQLSLSKLLSAQPFVGKVDSLVCLETNMLNLYSSSHWAIQGRPPAFDTPDSDTYLIGRNITLLAKVGVLCAQKRIGMIALGPLAGNPFPDATENFFNTMARALSLGLDHTVEIVAPLRQLSKAKVIQLGLELQVPFELTMSCMSPRERNHCGQCSKCRERHDAFEAIGIKDPAKYVAKIT